MDDRAYWMYKVSRLEPVYLDKVEVFLEAAQKDARNKQPAEMNCPCRDCKNLRLFPLAQLSTMRGHLLRRGFTEDYTCWTKHGEKNYVNVTDDQVDADDPTAVEDDTFDDDYGCILDEMLRHAAQGKQVAMQHLPSKEAYSSVSIGCAKNTRVSKPLHPILEGV